MNFHFDIFEFIAFLSSEIGSVRNCLDMSCRIVWRIANDTKLKFEYVQWIFRWIKLHVVVADMRQIGLRPRISCAFVSFFYIFFFQRESNVVGTNQSAGLKNEEATLNSNKNVAMFVSTRLRLIFSHCQRAHHCDRSTKDNTEIG